jgi:hypothetical protein
MVVGSMQGVARTGRMVRLVLLLIGARGATEVTPARRLKRPFQLTGIVLGIYRTISYTYLPSSFHPCIVATTACEYLEECDTATAGTTRE